MTAPSSAVAVEASLLPLPMAVAGLGLIAQTSIFVLQASVAFLTTLDYGESSQPAPNNVPRSLRDDMQSVTTQPAVLIAHCCGASLRRSISPCWNDSLATSKRMSTMLDASRTLDDGISVPLLPASEHQSMCAHSPCCLCSVAACQRCSSCVGMFRAHCPKRDLREIVDP
jgi:hypothetical protein